MVLSAKSPLMRSRADTRRGIALPAVIFALLIVTMLGATAFVMTDMHARTISNRERSMRAMHLAEAGAAHAIGIVSRIIPDTALSRLLLGPDKNTSGTDNGLLTGWGIPAGQDIPAAGVATTDGRYFVRLSDDVVDPTPSVFDDGNSRIRAVCRGVTTDGATATAEVLLGVAAYPAFGANGPMGISGNPVVRGECGDVHGNGLVTVSGTPRVEGEVTGSTTISGAANIDDLTGAPNAPLQNQPPIDIPDLNPMDYCGAAKVVLQANGQIILRGPPDVTYNGITGALGWKRSSSSPVIWTQTGGAITPGTLCVEGNLELSGSPGLPASPLALSIIATGSVTISGNPYLTSSDPRGIGVIAGGDVSISGNPTAGSLSYNGLIYAGSQCAISGNPNIQGSVLCDNRALPAGAKDMISQNMINGDPTIIYQCGGLLAGLRRVLFWYQQLNQP